MRSLLVLAAVLAIGGPVGSADEKPRRVKPVVVFSGTDNAVEKRAYVRCLSEKELHAVWSTHCGKDWKTRRTPQVDFESQMVVFIFSGKGDQNAGVSVPEVLGDGHSLRVRFRVLYYQTSVREGADDEVIPVPDLLNIRSYAIIVLPSTNMELVMDEDMNHTIGNPPNWKEAARLPAVRGK